MLKIETDKKSRNGRMVTQSSVISLTDVALISPEETSIIRVHFKAFLKTREVI